MPTKFQIAMTKEARAAAAAFSTPEVVAEYARSEIVEIFGDFDLPRYYEVGGTYVSHHFKLGADEFATYPLDPETWRVDLCVPYEPEPLLPAYQLVFTQRARDCEAMHEWPAGHLELSARIALAKVDPVDAGCAVFWVPIVEQKFVAWDVGGGRVEIDAIDEDETAASE